MKVGNGMEDGDEQGPIIDQQGLEKIERHVADALEAEDRIEDIEGNGGHGEVGISRPRRQEAGHGAGFANALLEDLPVRSFPVGGQGIGVHRLVMLPRRRINPRLTKEPIHTKGAGLVRNDGHHIAPKGGILQERA